MFNERGRKGTRIFCDLHQMVCWHVCFGAVTPTLVAEPESPAGGGEWVEQNFRGIWLHSELLDRF